MKNAKSLLAACAILATAGYSSQAQSTTNAAPSVPGFVTQFGDYLTTVNTNYNYQPVSMWTAAVYQNNVNVSDEVGVSWDLWEQNVNGGLFAAVESRTRNAGIAGTVVSEGGGMEFGYMKYSLKVGVFGDGVYVTSQAATLTSKAKGGYGAGEVGLFVNQMFSSTAGAGLFVSLQTGARPLYPLIGANLNFSFGNGKGLLGLF